MNTLTKTLLLLFAISIALPSLAQKNISKSKHEFHFSIGILNIAPCGSNICTGGSGCIHSKN